jgi:hypothetical protein
MTTLTFKKTVTVLVATGFAVSLAACGKQAEAPKKPAVSQDTATITLDFENDKKVDGKSQDQAANKYWLKRKKLRLLKIKLYLMPLKRILRLKKKVALLRRLMANLRIKRLTSTGYSMSTVRWPIRALRIFI